MAQQSNTTNWIFPQSLNGQPQVVKLLQAIPTSSKGINSTIAGQPVKMYKTVNSHQEPIQTTMTSAQVIKTFGSKLTATPVPAGTYAQTYQKTPDGKLIARTVRLTPQQMQNVKFLPNPQKIQLATSPQLSIKPKPQESPELVRIARKRDAFDLDFTPETKRKKTEKIGKGLRHFSMKVCEKVKMKKTTTYNEVADELVTEFSNSAKNNSLAEQYDQKNIRRRVYDALNVLMAMNIISKEKKEIRWIGLPSNSQKEHADLEREKRQRLQSIRDKTRLLQELIMNQISFKNLAHRNKQAEESHGVPTQNSYIQLPFIVVNTDKKTVIDCSISNDKMEYHFHFNDKFEILDDLEVLKKIGMLKGIDKGECSEEDLQLFKSFVPKSLEQYVDQLAQGSNGMEEFDDMTSPEDRCEQGTSHEQYISDDMIEATLGEDSHHSSSFDAMSPVNGDFSDDDDLDSDISSEDS